MFAYNDFTGKWHTYTTKVGSCSDFSNILVIMCREHNIPCNTIENDGHEWNLVYLNGNWMEIDITADRTAWVYGKDITKVDRAESSYCYNSLNPVLYTTTYIRTNNDAKWINSSLVDYAVMSGQRSYYDPSLLDGSVMS